MNPKHDRQGVRTARDLEQKYEFGAIAGAEKQISMQKEAMSQTNQTVAQFVASVKAEHLELQRQIDVNKNSIRTNADNIKNKVNKSGWTANKYLGTDSEGKITELDVPNGANLPDMYPVGSIYMSVNSTNPETLFGGTWERFAKGRVLVGVDEGDVDFEEVNKTGGFKTNTHNHPTNFSYDGSGFFAMATNDNHDTAIEESVDRGYFAPTNSEVGRTRRDSTWNTEINIMQPYITCYMWCRTA